MSTVLMDNNLSVLVEHLTPEMVWEEVPKTHPYYEKLAGRYKVDRTDLDRCNFKIRIQYSFNSFVQVEGVWYAEYFADNPLCWTDNPSDWWWKKRRHIPSFQDLLIEASGKPLRILKEIGRKIEPVVIPNPIEWRIVE